MFHVKGCLVNHSLQMRAPLSQRNGHKNFKSSVVLYLTVIYLLLFGMRILKPKINTAPGTMLLVVVYTNSFLFRGGKTFKMSRVYLIDIK